MEAHGCSWDGMGWDGRWCRANDGECRKIAAAAGRIYENFVGRDAALDYVEMVRAEGAPMVQCSVILNGIGLNLFPF